MDIFFLHKSSKLYFADTGLAAYLAMIIDGKSLEPSIYAGPFFENFVMNEKCAAGTGRFFEVMARVLNCTIQELPKLAAQAEQAVPISSICKNSDLVCFHLDDYIDDVRNAVLESRFRPFTASLGLLCSQRYDAADYGGDVAASDRSRTSDVYAFAQLKGRLWRIDYVVGLGVSTYYFRRNASSHRFTLLRPKLTVQYPLARRLKLRYDIELSEYMSRMAATGSAAIMVNSMEADEGNPGLRPYRRVEQSLRLSYDAARLSASLQATYRVNRDCNMERYSRRTDAAGNTVFVKTQANGGDCSMFYATGYCRADIVACRLSLTAGGGLYRFINIGADYRHFYTAFNGSMSVAAYFGKLALTAAADNGWRFMEGESRGRQGGAVYMTVAYRLGRFSLAAYWQHPFRSTITSASTELMNRFVSKNTTERNGNLGNLLGISVSWTMEKGRKYEAISRQ